MAAREFHGRIFNNWDTALLRVADDCDSGQWQGPWYPSKMPGAGRVEPQQWGEWRSESDGIMTGTSGWARWAVRVLEVSEGVEHFEYVQVNWSVPFNQLFSDVDVTCGVSRINPGEHDAFARPDKRLPILELVPSRRGAAPGASNALVQLGELVAHLPAIASDMRISERPEVEFSLRRRQAAQTQSPLTEAPSPSRGVLYAITPRVEASLPTGLGEGMGGRPASGGDLMWYRHEGRGDGAFQWAFNEGKKVGVGWDMKHLFSG